MVEPCSQSWSRLSFLQMKKRIVIWQLAKNHDLHEWTPIEYFNVVRAVGEGMACVAGVTQELEDDPLSPCYFCLNNAIYSCANFQGE